MPAQTSVSKVQLALPAPAAQPSVVQPSVIAAAPRPDSDPALPSKAAERAVQGAPNANLQLALPTDVVVVPRPSTSSPYARLKSFFAEANDPVTFNDVEAVDARERTQRCVYSRKTPDQLTEVDVWHATVRSRQQGTPGQGPLFPAPRERQYVGYGDRALAERVGYDNIKVATTPRQITTETRSLPADPAPYSTSAVRKKGDLLAFSFNQPNHSPDPVFGYCWREPAPAPKGG